MKNLIWGVLVLLFAFANAYQWSFNKPVRRVRWGLNQERVYYPLPEGLSAQDFFSRAMVFGGNSQIEKSGIGIPASDNEAKADYDGIGGKTGCHCGKCFQCILGQKQAINAPEVKNKDDELQQVSHDESTKCKCGTCDRCVLKQQQQRGSPRLFGLGGGYGQYGGGYGQYGGGYDPYYDSGYGGYPEYYESYYEGMGGMGMGSQGMYPYREPYYRPHTYW